MRVPEGVREAAGDRPLRLVWENEVGGLTFEAGTEPDRLFVKWAPDGSGLDLNEEAARLRWAVAFTPVPEVIGGGAGTDGAWLATRALPGENAVAARWLARPRAAVIAIGEGLRAMHEALPVGSCPFDWSAKRRLAGARRRAAAGLIDPAGWHESHRHLSVDRAIALLADVPEPDLTVVCHGDACAPNTLLRDSGAWTGHVDLEQLGVADRWADLAVATWSAGWNYGPGWERLLLDAYGVAPDVERTRYYRLLWDLDP